MKAPTACARLGRAALLLLLALAAGIPPARAADATPPERLTYQGFLVDANGLALGNTAPKNYDVIFRIYDSSSGGIKKWTEQQTLTVDKGYFSVLLGEGAQVGTEFRPPLSTLFAATDASDRYVEITVKGIGAGGTDSTILPRLRLLTAPYAFLAKSASQLVNAAGSPYVSVSGTNVTVAGTISANSITATSFTGNGASLTGLTAAQIPSLDANKITTGTLNDARHSSNVPLKNAANTFSGNNTFSSTGNSFAGYGTIPLGGIIMWSGSTTSLPAGWKLCDGAWSAELNQWLPNMSGKFVLGYQSGTYSMGATGGASSKSLSTSEMPGHSHTGSGNTGSAGSHAHIYYSGANSTAGISNGDKDAGEMGRMETRNLSESAGNHAHSYSFTTSSAGSGNSFSIMPPYFVMAYIIRVQ